MCACMHVKSWAFLCPNRFDIYTLKKLFEVFPNILADLLSVRRWTEVAVGMAHDHDLPKKAEGVSQYIRKGYKKLLAL